MVVVSFIFVGCMVNDRTEIKDLHQEIIGLKSDVLQLESTIESFGDSIRDLEALKAQYDELKGEISRLDELINLNQTHGDLTQLTLYEQEKYEEFKSSYIDDVLVGLKPISICKMYLHASLVKDYETEYELYTTNEAYVLWSKEEDNKIPNEHRLQEFDVYKDIYDVGIIFSESNSEQATITWKSKNGYVDEKLGAITYGFSLVKDGDVWKVNFLPMQQISDNTQLAAIENEFLSWLENTLNY